VTKKDEDFVDLFNFFAKLKKLKCLEFSLYSVKEANKKIEFYGELINKLTAIEISLHMPRKGLNAKNIKMLAEKIKKIKRKKKISAYIFHHSEYKNLEKEIFEYFGKNKVLIENPDVKKAASYYSKNLKPEKYPGVVIDIEHFYKKNGKFSFEIFKNFLELHAEKIKEVHFSKARHNLFKRKDIPFFNRIVKLIFAKTRNHNLRFICEGTEKKYPKDKLKIEIVKNIKIIITLLKKYGKTR